MKCRSVLAVFVLVVPSAAYACGGRPDYVDISLLLALLIAMVSAFLIPLAGIFAISRGAPWATARMFGVYGAATAAAILSVVFGHPSSTFSAVLILLSAVLLLAPSVHYLAYALKTTRVSRPDRSALTQPAVVRS